MNEKQRLIELEEHIRQKGQYESNFQLLVTLLNRELTQQRSDSQQVSPYYRNLNDTLKNEVDDYKSAKRRGRKDCTREFNAFVSAFTQDVDDWLKRLK